MPKQKELKELNTSIKDFVSVMDKQIGKLKNVDPKHALKETTNKDNKDNMTKEANESHKPKTPKKNPKTPKQQKNSTTQCDNIPKSTTCKRNATEISPLEEKPGKKQKEKLNTPQTDETNEDNDQQEEETSTHQSTDKIKNIPIEKEQHNKAGIYLEHSHEHDTNPILQELLATLRDIQKSIVNLDGKLDRELNTREKEHKELNEKLSTQ